MARERPIQIARTVARVGTLHLHSLRPTFTRDAEALASYRYSYVVAAARQEVSTAPGSECGRRDARWDDGVRMSRHDRSQFPNRTSLGRAILGDALGCSPRRRSGVNQIPRSFVSKHLAPQATCTSNPKSFSGDSGTASLLAARWPAREFAREPPGHLRRRSDVRMRSALLHSTGTTSAGRTGKRWLNGLLDHARRALRSPTESGRRGNRIEFWRRTRSLSACVNYGNTSQGGASGPSPSTKRMISSLERALKNSKRV